MAAAGASIPPEFAEEFERLGEPVVIHRLTRFEDPALRRAAREWLAQREAARQAARHGQELATERRGRRRSALFIAALVLVWMAVLFVFFVLRP